MSDSTRTELSSEPSTRALIQAHLRGGWIGLLVFVLLGIALETLHAFKIGAYLGVGNDTRRLMWTLAHAHGIGLSLVQLAFAATLGALLKTPSPRLTLASRALHWAAALIPAGFFLGGVNTYEGDPGLGILLVPLGAAALVLAVSLVAWTVTRASAH